MTDLSGSVNRHCILVNDKPVRENDLIKAMTWLTDERRRVALTDIADGIRVSTVFLGLDHSFGGGPPVLWETMIFGGNLDGHQERYTHIDHARNGHEEACESARRALELGKTK